MRISDWSSDVCSFDLEGWPTQTVNALRPRLPDTNSCWLELFRKLGLAILCGTPERVIDDAQLWHLCSYPFGLGVWSRDAPASAWILDIALPVPHENTGIEFVVENAGAARNMSADRRIAPSPAERTRNPFTVQVGRDCPRAPPGCELTEDAPDDQRLGLVDRALPA